MYLAVVSLITFALAVSVARVYRSRSPSTLVASSLALAFGFSLLSACVALTYVWGPAKSVHGQFYVAVPAFLSFSVLFITHIAKHRPKSESVIAAVVLCGLSVYFGGPFVWLLTACVHGDCI